MPDWSIKIVPSGSGGAAFVPDLQGAKPGDPLRAQQDDLVTWNNTTGDSHQPWPTNSSYQPLQVQRTSAEYLSDVVAAGGSSRPSYDVAQPSPTSQTWTIYYYCKLHPNVATERGTIIGTAVPTS